MPREVPISAAGQEWSTVTIRKTTQYRLAIYARVHERLMGRIVDGLVTKFLDEEARKTNQISTEK